MTAGLIVGLALCELILRIQEPFFNIMARHFALPTATDHPVWNHWAPPGISVRLAADDLEPYEFFTNSIGCRDPREPATPKPDGLKRILVMGDSFTEGYRYEETIAPRLEKQLSEAFESSKFEVINCGCTTYSPILHYLRLKHQLLALQPDYIILNIDLTDIYDDYWRYRPKYKVGADGEPLSSGSAPSSGWGRRVKDLAKESSYLFRLISGIRGKALSQAEAGASLAASDIPPPLPEHVFAYHWSIPVESEEWNTHVRFCLGNILRVVELCNRQAVQIAITMYPHRQQIKPDEGGVLWHREFERRVEQLCREQGVSFFSAYDGLSRAFNEGQPIYREKDIHFTNLGHRLWADLISDHFINLLDDKTIGRQLQR
jgi:lysophospholipase L1-like esterase